MSRDTLETTEIAQILELLKELYSGMVRSYCHGIEVDDRIEEFESAVRDVLDQLDAVDDTIADVESERREAMAESAMWRAKYREIKGAVLAFIHANEIEPLGLDAVVSYLRKSVEKAESIP